MSLAVAIRVAVDAEIQVGSALVAVFGVGCRVELQAGKLIQSGETSSSSG